jgi:hypothetical protein
MEKHHKAVLPELADNVIRQFFIDHICAVNLLRESRIKGRRNDQHISSDREFWQKMISEHSRPLSRILLEGNFQVVDWFPRSPGLFHTKEAEIHRSLANEYLRTINSILHYEPGGKANMIQGGIGSVRFKTIRINDIDCWLCTATSDGYCHSGIPLAIPDPVFREIGALADKTFSVIGQVRFLPDFMEHHFDHLENIPQVYVLVDEMISQGHAMGPVELTPMVFFVGKKGEWNKGPRSVTYVRCYQGRQNELTKARNWISWYVEHYGERIITNFDQQRPAFRDAPFSLQALMSAQVNLSEIENLHISGAEVICNAVNNVYSEVENMTQILVKLGDGTVIEGNLVVANSIKDSFNKVATSNSPNELKSLLIDLARAVGKMVGEMPSAKGEEVARDLDSLTSEATSKNPRRRWWELSVEGLTNAAQTVGAIGKPVLEILAKLVPLLPMSLS